VKENEIQDELTSIRTMMERSSKFISLSGLSGVLAGVYALIGAAAAYFILYYSAISDRMEIYKTDPVPALFIIALIVLIASIATGVVLTIRKAKKKGQPVWGNTSRQLLFNMAVPLFTGGALMLILINRGYFGVVASASLVFYGLALVNASIFSFKDVRYLGICDIFLGLLAGLLPGYGLLFWAIGFGVLHIVYGSIMYIKYDR
jgi:predicted lysophospholipase L1 biosynthesis ABC-type transport system permease subunit